LEILQRQIAWLGYAKYWKALKTYFR
jgi:hypothetical protein